MDATPRPRGRENTEGDDPQRGPEPVDIHVGSRVRLRRTLLGMSQDKLGQALGLTFQQIQKYERGANRIGASRLYQLSRVLDVPVSFFFDDMEDRTAQITGQQHAGGGLGEQPQEPFDSPNSQLLRRETLELVRAYYRIPSAKVRRRLFELAKSLARDTDEAEPGATTTQGADEPDA